MDSSRIIKIAKRNVAILIIILIAGVIVVNMIFGRSSSKVPKTTLSAQAAAEKAAIIHEVAEINNAAKPRTLTKEEAAKKAAILRRIQFEID